MSELLYHISCKLLLLTYSIEEVGLSKDMGDLSYPMGMYVLNCDSNNNGDIFFVNSQFTLKRLCEELLQLKNPSHCFSIELSNNKELWILNNNGARYSIDSIDWDIFDFQQILRNILLHLLKPQQHGAYIKWFINYCQIHNQIEYLQKVVFFLIIASDQLFTDFGIKQKEYPTLTTEMIVWQLARLNKKPKYGKLLCDNQYFVVKLQL